MAGLGTSPSWSKQPLAERDSNVGSPNKSPTKIALPPSPIGSPTMITKSKMGHSRSSSQDMMEPVIENPLCKSIVSHKPDMVRKIAEAHMTGQTYVSPSDDIFSPTTQKLNDVKAKRFGGFNKKSSLYNAQMLFPRPSGKDQPAEPFTILSPET